MINFFNWSLLGLTATPTNYQETTLSVQRVVRNQWHSGWLWIQLFGLQCAVNPPNFFYLSIDFSLAVITFSKIHNVSSSMRGLLRAVDIPTNAQKSGSTSPNTYHLSTIFWSAPFCQGIVGWERLPNSWGCIYSSHSNSFLWGFQLAQGPRGYVRISK